MRLKGRTLWLIGASSGIGAALAPALAREGAILALSARREDELNRVADGCTGSVRPLVKPLDVTDLEQVERVYAELKQTWGRVDIVFYNPAVWAQTTAKAFDTQGALRQIDTMYAGLVRVVGTAMPDMIARRSGDIVGMASLAGYAGMPKSPAYSSAKSAVIALLQSLRIELKDCGVGVVTVNPGFVRTPLTDRNDFPMPFMMEPEVAAELIVKGLLEGKEEIHFPWKLSWPAKVVTALPRSVYEYLARKFIAKL